MHSRGFIALVAFVSLFLTGCPNDDAGCSDLDGDGYGAGCFAGTDCDDNDADNWNACSSCIDNDGDGSFVGCDAYTTRSGPDCNDADADNQTSCSTCLDGDSDSSFVGCDQYVVRSGPDCNDADADNQTSCSTCLDGDGDGSFVGCDAYATRSGPDCDDGDDAISWAASANEATQGCMEDADGDGYGSTTAPPGGIAGTDCSDTDVDNWASCSTCVDGDLDLAFGGCDAYATRVGPDCDDGDERRSPIEPELADDGIDNDCSGQDLVATSAAAAIYVDENDTACTDGLGAGSIATPWCSLQPALESISSDGDVFVAAGSYSVSDGSLNASGAVRVYGSYPPGFGPRDLSGQTTLIETGGATVFGLIASAREIVIDGLDFERNGSIANQELFLVTSDLLAITRSTFTATAGNRPVLQLSGDIDGLVPQGDLVIRDSDFVRVPAVSGAYSVGSLDWFERVRIERNRFDFRIPNQIVTFSAGLTQGVAAPSNERIWLFDNSVYSEAPTTLLEASTRDQDVVVGNSVEITAATGGRPALRLWTPSLIAANNAYRTADNGQLFVLGSVSLPDPSPLMFLNNVAQSAGPRPWGVLSSTARSNWTFDTAAGLNGCTFCTQSGGNVDGDILWISPASDDFSLSPTSPGLDGGTDPSLMAPYVGAFDDRDGAVRPADGDGMNGAQWDVGAIEN